MQHYGQCVLNWESLNTKAIAITVLQASSFMVLERFESDENGDSSISRGKGEGNSGKEEVEYHTQVVPDLGV